MLCDTSQTYQLFQTLLLLFLPHSCMILMKLTRTDAVFSRAACMIFLCVGLWIFRCPRKFPQKYRKSTHLKEPKNPGALLAWPPPGRAGWPLGWVPPPLVTYLGPYFYPSRGNPRTEVVFPILVAEPPPLSVLLREG